MKVEWTKAKQAYSTAIELRPRDTTLIQARARVQGQLKEWGLAARDYETAVKLDANNGWLQMALAESFMEAGKLDIDPWQRRELDLLRTEAEKLIKPKP